MTSASEIDAGVARSAVAAGPLVLLASKSSSPDFVILYGQMRPNRTHGFAKTNRIGVKVVVNVRLPGGSFNLVEGVDHAEC